MLQESSQPNTIGHTSRAHTTYTRSPVLLTETKLMGSTTKQKPLYYYCFVTKLPPVLKVTCNKNACQGYITSYLLPPQASGRISPQQHDTSSTTINSTQEDLTAIWTTWNFTLTFKIQKAPLTDGLISGTLSQHSHWPSALSCATCRWSFLCMWWFLDYSEISCWINYKSS